MSQHSSFVGWSVVAEVEDIVGEVEVVHDASVQDDLHVASHFDHHSSLPVPCCGQGPLGQCALRGHRHFRAGSLPHSGGMGRWRCLLGLLVIVVDALDVRKHSLVEAIELL